MYNFFALSPLGIRSKYKDKYPLETRDVFRTQSNIYDGTFCEKSSQLKVGNYFGKRASS